MNSVTILGLAALFYSAKKIFFIHKKFTNKTNLFNDYLLHYYCTKCIKLKVGAATHS